MRRRGSTDAVQSELPIQRLECSNWELKGNDAFGTTGRRRHLYRGMRVQINRTRHTCSQVVQGRGNG